ncbi:MAG: hypothetical protein H7Y02_09625, partial [Candidatus Obscuribacterales bacterium]|nr:hypothetical protein [Steroidobacteraceae bacterium]
MSTTRVPAYRCALTAVLVAVYLGSTAAANAIDYDPRRSPILRPCDEHSAHGRQAEAKECYSQVVGSVTDYQTRAEAAWALNDLPTANMLFRQAGNIKTKDSQVRVRWGRLFLGTHQHNEALKLFNEALALNPQDPQAKLAVAQVYADRFEGEARKLALEVLGQDNTLIEAHLLMARMSLEEGQLEAAEKSIEQALTLSERAKLPPLEAWALYAALELRSGSGKQTRWIEKALAYNPRYGGGYELLAHFEAIRRRYREASEFLRRAIEVEPELASARAELGANLLRLGEVEEGQKQLAQAYDADPYSVTTVNTLRLLDRFSEYDLSTADKVTLRLHNKEQAILKPYVRELAQQSINVFTKRYGFTLKQPVTIELYPNHDDFAVRVAGLPGIGLLGVTFGYLVAMDSPSGRAAGDFHWGSTLWHEMAHVFTLEATEHRVPRWLSEGISVFEEWRTGPTPGVVVTPDVLEALRDGRFLKIDELDSGFIRPTYPNQIQVSYMQAGLTYLFIEQRFGFEKLVALLRQYERDTNVSAAVQSAFKISTEEFDRQFMEFVRQRYARILPRLADWSALQAKAVQAIEKEAWPAAVDAARESIELNPEYVGTNSPYILLAHAQAKQKQFDAQLSTLLAFRAAGGWEADAFNTLATLLQERGRRAEAIDVWLALNYATPLQAESHTLVGEQLLAEKRADEAAREYGVLLALDTHDK